jgi:hypothetical protein
MPNGNEVIASVAVDMGKAGFREAKQEIESHLEKTAQPAFYGLDGVAYRGLRTRKLTLAGLLELLVPLLIAGLTVLNTMRGSVYERRAELYVYNAVGIAPRYVVAMFLAEAFVYAVVGSVLGYLLSQGVGRVLSALNLTGGLNMTFTSIATIYASLAIAAAVFVSTWFPARSAMDIASPAEESGWKLPEPDAPLSLRNLGTATAVLRELAPDAQARVLALLVDAAAVDGNLDPREHALLLAASAALGIDATALEDRLLRQLKAPDAP